MKKVICLLLALSLLGACSAGVSPSAPVETENAPSPEPSPTGSLVLSTPIVMPTTTPVEVVERAPIGEEDFLVAQGRDLYTLGGELVNLRGVNIGGWLLQEFWMTGTTYSANVTAEYDVYEILTERFGKETMEELVALYQASYFTTEDFERLRAMGVNCLRLPFWYRNIVDETGELYPDWYETFDWFLEEAGKRGMYVILDMHGAPGSQNGSDHSGFDGHDQKEEASRFFFGEEAADNQALFYTIWETIAERYRGNPVVAGYDLLNEPYCTYRYNSKLSDKELRRLLWDIYDEAYRRIRAIDPEHIVVMEATWDPADLPKPSEYGWENVMYQYHNYLYDDYDNEKGQQIANMQAKINKIRSAAYNVPSLMGEFNYFNRTETWDKGLKLLNDAGLSWTVWTYKVTASNGNWGFFHQPNTKINLETASLEEIRAHWAKAGEAAENKALCQVLKNFINAPFSGNTMGS